MMIPILGLSVVTLAYTLERGVFWYKFLDRKNQLAYQVLEAARRDLREAAAIAEQAQDFPIGRFLLAPLKLHNPTPETFHLAIQTAADQELAAMQMGDRILETVTGLSPLLGLLGMATGLIFAFSHLSLGGAELKGDFTKINAGIWAALITMTTSMLLAIAAFVISRSMVALVARQKTYFARVGSELELIYRQGWEQSSTYAKRTLFEIP
jgi:biopolymer transport protein ExbB